MRADSSPAPIVVGRLVVENPSPGISRVSAQVGEEKLWFESAEMQMAPSTEGFGSVLLVPAMSHGRNLVFEDPVCATWLANIQDLMAYHSRWWGWPPIRIEAKPADVRGRAKEESRALCFSGGADSFYSLLTYPQPIDKLVMVHGYDIRLDDADGARSSFDHVRQVAETKGIEAVMVRTNYREHPLAGKKYKYAYGGALFGVGHLLANVGEMILSSGFRYDEARPDGSHWQTDPLWSSAAMKAVHYGAGLIRDEKLRAICNDPLLKKHLRVCQQNLSGGFHISEKSLNCGTCQKCVRTLLVLGQEVGIDDIEIFANTADLDVHLYKETNVGTYLYKAYREISRRGVDKRMQVSINALLRRSRVINRFEWAGRRGSKLLYGIYRWVDALERKALFHSAERK